MLALAGAGAGLVLSARGLRPVHAQERWGGTLEGACSFYPDAEVSSDIYTFGSSDEARQIVETIAASSGLRPNFAVLQANVPNAAAVIRDTERYILYSEVFMDEVSRGADTKWAAWTIMAHEVGHHLNGHTLIPGGSRPPTELEADEFAGFAVARNAGSLDEALAAFQQLSEEGSETHPPRSARLEAVTRGYRNGEAAGVVGSSAPARSEGAVDDINRIVNP